MTTITIAENIDLKKSHFQSVEEFQLYLLQVQHEADLSPRHKLIIDKRIADVKQNPEAFVSLKQLKANIQRAASR